MKKKQSLKSLIKRLDDVFQKCIRYRDGFKCITCGKKFEVGNCTDLHAGHYISRKIYATRWDEENVNAQCAVCNLKQSLADVEVIHKYEQELTAKYGYGVLERLFKKKHETFKLSKVWLEEQIKLYSEALENYKKM